MKGAFMAMRSIVGVVGAYLLIGAIMIVVFELALGDVSFRESPAGVLALAGLCGIVASVLAGYIGTWIAGRAPRWHALAMIGLITFDTTWILVKKIGTDPAWFTVASGIVLALGIVVGVEIRARRVFRGPMTDRARLPG